MIHDRLKADNRVIADDDVRAQNGPFHDHHTTPDLTELHIDCRMDQGHELTTGFVQAFGYGATRLSRFCKRY